MTRGTLVAIINDDEMLVTDEFNGDMYYDGHGEDVIKMFGEMSKKEGISEEQIKEEFHNFNNDHHNYDEFNVRKVDIVGDNDLDSLSFDQVKANGQYYNIWFSDYVYIINLSEEHQDITDSNGSEKRLEVGESIILNFGEFYFPGQED